MTATWNSARGCLVWRSGRGITVLGFPALPAQTNARGRVVEAARAPFVEVIGPQGGARVGGRCTDPADLFSQADDLSEAGEWLRRQLIDQEKEQT